MVLALLELSIEIESHWALSSNSGPSGPVSKIRTRRLRPWLGLTLVLRITINRIVEIYRIYRYLA